MLPYIATGNAGCRCCYSADFKEITLAYLGVPWVFTRVLASEEEGQKNERQRDGIWRNKE